MFGVVGVGVRGGGSVTCPGASTTTASSTPVALATAKAISAAPLKLLGSHVYILKWASTQQNKNN